MALIEVAPSDELRVILCLKFDRRAPFKAVAEFKQNLIDCASAVTSLEASGAFDYMLEVALRDFAAYHELLDSFAEPLATLVERHEASFVCRRFLRPAERAPILWVPCRDGRRRIDCATIDRVRAEGDYVRICCGPQSWLLHSTMHHLREMLDPAIFLRLHRSTIVNVGFIERLVHRRNHWVAVLADSSEQRIAKSHVVAVLATLRTDSSAHDDASPIQGRSIERSAPPAEQAMRDQPKRAMVP